VFYLFFYFIIFFWKKTKNKIWKWINCIHTFECLADAALSIAIGSSEKQPIKHTHTYLLTWYHKQNSNFLSNHWLFIWFWPFEKKKKKILSSTKLLATDMTSQRLPVFHLKSSRHTTTSLKSAWLSVHLNALYFQEIHMFQLPSFFQQVSWIHHLWEKQSVSICLLSHLLHASVPPFLV
jgi:hypothetical protein